MIFHVKTKWNHFLLLVLKNSSFATRVDRANLQSTHVFPCYITPFESMKEYLIICYLPFIIFHFGTIWESSCYDSLWRSWTPAVVIHHRGDVSPPCRGIQGHLRFQRWLLSCQNQDQLCLSLFKMSVCLLLTEFKGIDSHFWREVYLSAILT